MTVDELGRLESAIQDTCKKYEPILKKPLGIHSVKMGLLYKCASFKGKDKNRSCAGCDYLNKH